MRDKRFRIIGAVLLGLPLAILAGVFFLEGFAGKPVVTIANEADVQLAEVNLIGETWRHSVQDLDPGSKAEVTPLFRGETGMAISFSAKGKSYSPQNGIYLESSGGYRISVVVRKDFSVGMEYGKHNLRL